MFKLGIKIMLRIQSYEEYPVRFQICKVKLLFHFELFQELFLHSHLISVILMITVSYHNFDDSRSIDTYFALIILFFDSLNIPVQLSLGIPIVQEMEVYLKGCIAVFIIVVNYFLYFLIPFNITFLNKFYKVSILLIVQRSIQFW
jgi:hypothetical protein